LNNEHCSVDEPASPTPPVETAEHSDTTSPESNTSPKSTGRGPRIKHVCRKAAVVLGKTVARFPQTELTLSALPKGEKKRILKQDELDKAGGITKVFVNKFRNFHLYAIFRQPNFSTIFRFFLGLISQLFKLSYFSTIILAVEKK
jgi:hypothetical protein